MQSPSDLNLSILSKANSNENASTQPESLEKNAFLSKIALLNVKSFAKGMNREPKNIYCDDCQREVLSEISFDSGTGSIISSCLITMLGFWCGCCLIPFCLSDCQDVSHICTSCGKELQKVKFLLN